MNKLQITLGGRTYNLRFGGMAWECFVLNYEKCIDSRTKSMACLIYAGIVNEEEITGVSQGVTFEELIEPVDSAFYSEEETAYLTQAEAMFQHLQDYKKMIKSESEKKGKKKDASPLKS